MKIGVLALQGDFDAHRRRLEELGAEVVLIKKPGVGGPSLSRSVRQGGAFGFGDAASPVPIWHGLSQIVTCELALCRSADQALSGPVV